MNVELHLGDCLDVLPTIPDGSIDLTVTSPPYDNLRTYNGNNDQWGEHVWRQVLSELYRVTSDGGVVVWIVNDATINGSETGTSFKQALHAMGCGFRLHDTMIWDKGAFSAVGSTTVRYGPVFEFMFVLSKGRPTFNALRDRKNKHPGSVVGSQPRRPDGTRRTATHTPQPYGEYGIRFNIWKNAGKHDSDHPAVFPASIAEDHIRSWSNEGDTVLDPLMGSGTTGVAAKRLGRNFIGIELDQTYYDIASKRIKDAGLPLLDAVEELE